MKEPTVIVPAGVLDLLRDGLRSRMGVVGGRFEEAYMLVDRREHPERFQEPLRDIDALHALMAAIGWQSPAADTGVVLNVELHRWALMEALSDELETTAGLLSNSELAEERRAECTSHMTALSLLALVVLLRAHMRDRLALVLSALLGA